MGLEAAKDVKDLMAKAGLFVLRRFLLHMRRRLSGGTLLMLETRVLEFQLLYWIVSVSSHVTGAMLRFCTNLHFRFKCRWKRGTCWLRGTCQRWRRSGGLPAVLLLHAAAPWGPSPKVTIFVL